MNNIDQVLKNTQPDQNEADLQYIKSVVKSDNYEEKIKLFSQLDDLSLDEQVIPIICSMITDPDFGVRNAASSFLSFSQNQKVPAFIVPYISSEDISVRNLAGEILVRIGNNSVNPLIENLKKTDNTDDQKFIIDLLGLIRNPGCDETIIKILESTDNDNVKLACIETLGNLQSEKSVKVLFNLFGTNELLDPTILEALGKINTPEILEFIIAQYESGDELIKYSILECLGEIGNEETFFFLLSVLKETSGPLTWSIVGAINTLKMRYNIDIPFDEKTKNAILSTIYEGDTTSKIKAAELVTAFDDNDTIMACLSVLGLNFELDMILKNKLLQNVSDVYTKIPSLLDTANQNLKHLLQFLKECIDFDRATLESLSQIEFRNLIDYISKCLENPDEEVRSTAVDLLFEIEEETALLFIENMASDDNVWIRFKVLEYIERSYTPELKNVLLQLSQDSYEMINEKAKEILAEKNIN